MKYNSFSFYTMGSFYRNKINKITQTQNENSGNEVTSAESDDSDLDNQTYGEDDDDFIPTEEVPADESIPFPTNI